MIFIQKFQKGVILQKSVGGITVLAGGLMVVCICTKFRKIASTFLKLQSRHDFFSKHFIGA